MTSSTCNKLYVSLLLSYYKQYLLVFLPYESYISQTQYNLTQQQSDTP